MPDPNDPRIRAAFNRPAGYEQGALDAEDAAEMLASDEDSVLGFMQSLLDADSIEPIEAADEGDDPESEPESPDEDEEVEADDVEEDDDFDGPEESEDEDDEDEFDDEVEEDEDFDDASDDDLEPPSTFKVPTEDGKGVEEITAEEYEARQLRQADYTRKTQQVAEQRKAAEAELERARAERAEYARQLQTLESMIDAQMPEEPNWEALKKADPQRYLIERDNWNSKQEQLRQVRAEQQRLYARQQQDMEKRRAERVEQEQKALLEAIPEWQDSEKALEEVRALYATAMNEYGFSQEELAETYDHRAMLLLRDAHRYREMKAKSKKAKSRTTKSKDKTVAPSGKAPRSRKSKGSKKVRTAAERVENTGSREAATDLLAEVFFSD